MLYSVEGDITINAYSFPPSTYIGESNVNLVGTLASVDTLILAADTSTLLNGKIVVVG